MGKVTRDSAMLRLSMIARPALREEHQHCCSHQNGNFSNEYSEDHGVGSMLYENLKDSLSVMLAQEQSYQCLDYLRLTSILGRCTTNQKRGGKNGSKTVVDEYCRDQIVLWSYRVTDYFSIDREVVAISMSYLDRFMSVNPCNRRTFKLAATTTLQLAVKIHHPHSLKLISILSELSRGEFDMDDIATMEGDISKGLDWRLHPPTALCFVSTLLMCVPPSGLAITQEDTSTDAVLDFALFFVELAVCDFFFVTKRQSTVALAAILNSLEGLGFVSAPFYSSYIRELCSIVHLTPGCHEVVTSREKLWTLYERSEECTQNNTGTVAEESRPVDQCDFGSGDGKHVLISSDFSSPVSIRQYSAQAP